MKAFDSIRRIFRPRRRKVVMFGPATTTLPTGARTLVRNAAFRKAFIEASEFVEERRGWSPWRELGNDGAPEGITMSERNFVEETILQMCLFRAFGETNHRFDAIVGISLGDAAAGYASGALDFQETLHVMCETIRGVLCATGGDLIAVQASPPRVREVVGDAPVQMIFDWPVLSVWAVPDDAARRMQRLLRVAGIPYVRLGFNCLSHTERVDVAGLIESFEILSERVPRYRYYSTLEGGAVDRRAIPSDRWARAISEPVRLDEMWRAMRRDGYTDVIYVGSVPADKDLFGSLPEAERPTSFVRAESFLELGDDVPAADISVHADNAPASIGTVFRSTAFARDPYPFFRQWLGDSPVHKLPDDNLYVVLGYDAAQSVLKQPNPYSSSPFSSLSPILPGADPPLHTRVRKVLSPYYSRDVIMAKRESMRTATLTFLETLRARRSFDLVSEFAATLPFAISCGLLGLTQQSAAAIGPMHPDEVTWQDIETAMTEEGIIPQLVAGGQLERMEIAKLAPFLIGAGVVTVRDLICFSTYTLLRKPELLAVLTADPSMIPAFIEESLRHDAPIQGVVRKTVADAEIEGVRIPADTILWVWLGAANRDPSRFERPDDFIVGREGPRNISFGVGPHFCLGSHVGRMEAEVVIEALLPHLSHLRPTAPPDFVFTDFRASPVFPWVRSMRSWQLAFTA